MAALVRAAMPGVARMVAERRAQWGAAHVVECQRRGMAGEPGWFFAREGPIAVGTPWDTPEMANFGALAITSKQALVIMREPEGAGRGAQ